MENFEFQRDKYIFSNNKKHNKDINEDELLKEIKLLRRTYRKNGIKLHNISQVEINENRRNIILNIAMFVKDEPEILDTYRRHKKLPLIRIGEETGARIEFLRKYEDYLELYVILFSDKRYSQIVKYLNIKPRQSEDVKLLKVVGEQERQGLFKGITIGLHHKSIIILTRQGEVIKVRYIDNSILGEEIISKKFSGFSAYTPNIIGVSLILICIYCGLSFIYKLSDSKIVIRTTSEIKLDVNKFNRVVDANSPSEKGKELIENMKLENKKLDTAIHNILEYIDDNSMVPENGVINVAVTGDKINFQELTETNSLVKNQYNDKDKKERVFSLLINNSGQEETMSPEKQKPKEK